MNRQLRTHLQMKGYSTVELLFALVIVGILSAFATPSLVRTYRNSQLDDAANQVAGILRFTRSQAIRRNTTINCVNTEPTVGGSATMWSDDNGDGNVQGTEKQIFLNNASGANATLIPAGSVPDTATLAAGVNAGTLAAVSPNNGSLTFDGRGAVNPPAVSAYYLGNAAYGYRAIIVLPSGSIQAWSYATGGWQQAN